MLPAIAEFYPPSPDNVPPRLTQPTLRYRLQALLVVASLFLFLAVYLALLAGCTMVCLIAILAICTIDLHEYGRFGGAMIGTLIAVTGIGSGALALYFLKGLFKFGRADSPHLEITEAEQPRLFAFIRQICADTGAPEPARIIVSPEVNAGVFYACTFGGLFFPTRKNLHIGLGLVNALNLAEFKAVLAHEFGHFSQKSMRLGTYVYTANQIIRDIVLGHDWLDEYLSIFKPVLAVIRWVLGRLFRIINFAHASLGRQMEFQADLVAVSVAGSDAIVHGLLRTDFAYQCLEQTWLDLTAAADHGLATDDLFVHQSKTADYLRSLGDEPALGIPPALPAEPVAGPPVFPPDVMILPPMWASHPPHYEREQNCKRTYLRSPQDDRPAWMLFDNAAELRRRVTRRHFERVRPEPIPVSAAGVVQRFIDAERAETIYSARYDGLYEEGFIAPGPIDSLLPIAPSRYEQPARLLAEHADIFGPALRQRLKEYRQRRDDHRRLSRFAQGLAVPRGGVFTFRDKRCRTSDAPRLVQMLEAELRSDREELAKLDRRIFMVYMGMARQLGAEAARELEHRYRFHGVVQDMVRTLTYWEMQITQAFRICNAQREPDPLVVRTLVGALTRRQTALDDEIAAASRVRIPALKNMRAGDPLSFFLDAKPTIRGFIGTEQMLSGAWLKQMLERQADTIERLRRILFKSLGGLVSFQERVGEQWKERFARLASAPTTGARGHDVQLARTSAE